ncbi:MAG TPA: HPF/RaiA family ribosome-associated protein [Planctomycetota bacterium]
MRVDLKLEDPGKLLSEHLAGHVRERADKLAHFFGKLQQCRVVVDGPGQHPLPGRFRIRVYLAVPESRIVINHQSGEDIPMAIREAFDAADQRLEDYARIARESVREAKRRPSRQP